MTFTRPTDLPESFGRTMGSLVEDDLYVVRYRHVDVDEENQHLFGQVSPILAYTLDRQCGPGLSFYTPSVFVNPDADYVKVETRAEMVKGITPYYRDMSSKYRYLDVELHCTVRLFVIDEMGRVVGIYHRHN